jgi:hypothetical protein
MSDKSQDAVIIFPASNSEGIYIEDYIFKGKAIRQILQS